MRAIRSLLLLVLLAVVGVLAYNYWTGNGWTLTPPSATGIDAERAREKGAEVTRKAAETTRVAAERTGEVMSQAALTATTGRPGRPISLRRRRRRCARHRGSSSAAITKSASARVPAIFACSIRHRRGRRRRAST